MCWVLVLVECSLFSTISIFIFFIWMPLHPMYEHPCNGVCVYVWLMRTFKSICSISGINKDTTTVHFECLSSFVLSFMFMKIFYQNKLKTPENVENYWDSYFCSCKRISVISRSARISQPIYIIFVIPMCYEMDKRVPRYDKKASNTFGTSAAVLCDLLFIFSSDSLNFWLLDAEWNNNDDNNIHGKGFEFLKSVWTCCPKRQINWPVQTFLSLISITNDCRFNSNHIFRWRCIFLFFRFSFFHLFAMVVRICILDRFFVRNLKYHHLSITHVIKSRSN